MGWPLPLPDRAISMANETDVTSYSWPPVKVFMSKARQKLLSVVVMPPSLLHAIEFPSTMLWLVDSVIVGGHMAPLGWFDRAGTGKCTAPALPGIGTLPRALTNPLDPDLRGRSGIPRTSYGRSCEAVLGCEGALDCEGALE